MTQSEQEKEQHRRRVEILERLGPNELLHFSREETNEPSELFVDRKVMGMVYPDTATLKAHIKERIHKIENYGGEEERKEHLKSIEEILKLGDGYRVVMGSSLGEDRPTKEDYDEFLRKLKLYGVDSKPLISLVGEF